MALEAKYIAKEVEDKWYQYWMEHRYFHSEVDDREPYTIVIPPPTTSRIITAPRYLFILIPFQFYLHL